MGGTDLERLKAGQPPLNGDLLNGMTLGRHLWVDPFREHYLQNYISGGGCKVKALIGSEGTGKTHLLRIVEQEARSLDYETVYISARQTEKRINDLPNLYRTIVAQIDKEKMVRGLCCKVASELGYNEEMYDGGGALLPILIEEENWLNSLAKKEIREAVGSTFKDTT